VPARISLDVRVRACGGHSPSLSTRLRALRERRKRGRCRPRTRRSPGNCNACNTRYKHRPRPSAQESPAMLSSTLSGPSDKRLSPFRSILSLEAGPQRHCKSQMTGSHPAKLRLLRRADTHRRKKPQGSSHHHPGGCVHGRSEDAAQGCGKGNSAQRTALYAQRATLVKLKVSSCRVLIREVPRIYKI
jgi:hypothetical protein